MSVSLSPLVRTAARPAIRAKRLIVSVHGFSLIEMMVAITIGLLLVLGISAYFVTSSQNFSENERMSRQIENGRYAMDLLSEDVRHAGFYGETSSLGTVPGVPPNPCATDVATITSALPIAIYGIDAPNAAPACLPDHVDGTDVLVIRRVNTTTVTAASAVANGYYTQTSSCPTDTVRFQLATSGFTLNKATATGCAVADIRQFRTNIYFVSPCSTGTGTGGACASSDVLLPTLKRMELGPTGFTVTPLVEGIENLQFEYGLDTTGPLGVADGAPDSYTARPAATGAAWTSVATVRIYVVARNIDATIGYTDTKVYSMGKLADGTTNNFAPGGSFKRHQYSAVVRVTNLSQRNEVPL